MSKNVRKTQILTVVSIFIIPHFLQEFHENPVQNSSQGEFASKLRAGLEWGNFFDER